MARWREEEPFRFHGAFRVTLSTEGSQKLSPRIPLDGWVRGTADGLIVVQESDGKESHYHPDFLEVA